jgi:2-oxoacid dehydrogenase/acyltransferase catalytic subunit
MTGFLVRQSEIVTWSSAGGMSRGLVGGGVVGGGGGLAGASGGDGDHGQSGHGQNKVASQRRVGSDVGMVQPECVFGGLEVLLNGPAGAQNSATACELGLLIWHTSVTRARQDPGSWPCDMFADGGGFGIAPLSLMSLQVVVGGVTERPRAVDGRIEVREVLDLTITFDHNIVDGAPAARFVAYPRRLIENAEVLRVLVAESDEPRDRFG